GRSTGPDVFAAIARIHPFNLALLVDFCGGKTFFAECSPIRDCERARHAHPYLVFLSAVRGRDTLATDSEAAICNVRERNGRFDRAVFDFVAADACGPNRKIQRVRRLDGEAGTWRRGDRRIYVWRSGSGVSASTVLVRVSQTNSCAEIRDRHDVNSG